MTPEQKAQIEAYAILRAHLDVFAALLNNAVDGDSLAAQLANLTEAVNRIKSIPRPQQQAA